jgi:selenocysteine lyase/cysteine desulfurase
MGFLWGRREALDRLCTFREDFIPNVPPAKIEVGTFVYENVAGMDAAISYLEALGKRLAVDQPVASRRVNVVRAMQAIRDYEASLSLELLCVLAELGADVYGICKPELVCHRVPTLCFNLKSIAPAQVVEKLAEAGIGARDGHMYSPRLMRRLGLRGEVGAVRISLVHYNTFEEIHHFRDVLRELVAHA